VRRGEIWWGEVADAGRRPFLIMTRDAAVPVLSSLVVAPVTRTVRSIPTELGLTREDGMPIDCAAAFDNLRVVPKAHLVERITTVDPLRMREACAAARRAIDCE
jgi:mRNA interferase MazF